MQGGLCRGRATTPAPPETGWETSLLPDGPTSLHTQSLVLAPLFVWFELLFLLGYRPGLKADIDRAIAANIAAHRAGIQPLLAGDK